jgi:hypothetical protein
MDPDDLEGRESDGGSLVGEILANTYFFSNLFLSTSRIGELENKGKFAPEYIRLNITLYS